MDIIELQKSGLDRDTIIVKLVTEAGMSLNAATKAYAECAKAEGWVKTVASHKEDALAYLAETYTVEDWDVNAARNAAIDLADKYNVVESTARDYCKSYSEQLGITHPISNPRTAIFEWFKEHDGVATKEDFIEFAVEELGRSTSNANEYWKGYELHRYLVGE